MTIEMFDLEPHQKELFNLFESFPSGKWIVTKSVRQVGKSICLEGLLIAAAVKNNNSVSMSISPVLSQSRKLHKEVANILNKVIKKNNQTLLELELINGSRILFRSSEQGDTLRGETIKNGGILVIDEAAYINSDVFYEVLVPTTNVYNADIFLFSTPKFKTGMFYDLFIQGLNGDNKVISVDWNNYDTSKFLNAETLEIYRKKLPKNAFSSEYLGQFIDGDGMVFTDFKRCVGEYKEDNEQELVVGIDWGTGQGSDSTVLTFGQFVDNKIQVHKCYGFNDLCAKDTISVIKSRIKQYIQQGYKDIRIVCEQNSIGNVFFDLLFDEMDALEQTYNNISIVCQKFLTTNKSKETLVKQLQVCFENEYIVLPEDSELMKQLTYYECKINSNGTPTYNAPSGLHDDYVISLGILVDRLYNEIDNEIL